MTGGLLSTTVTRVAGASDVFAGGWVTYSDRWKEAVLGVSPDLLAAKGAVSPEVARAMAEGARERAPADAALAVTGVAGPGDGRDPRGDTIPQGTFHVGLALGGRPTEVASHHIALPRRTVQRRATVIALDMLRRALAADSAER
jgi:PncC family amidohydrolase